MSTTTAAGADLEPLVADLKTVSAGRIAVRDVKIDDMHPDSRSQVVVYLTPPDPGSTWDLGDFSAVRARPGPGVLQRPGRRHPDHHLRR